MEKIFQKLKEHDGQFEQISLKSEQVDQRFDQIDRRFDQIDNQMDFLAKKAMEHDDRLERIEETMVTKSDIQEISTTLDKLVELALKKDQELTMTAHGLRRLEDRIDSLEENIQQLKPILHPM